MESIESRLSAAILTVIRARQEPPPIPEINPRDQTSVSAISVRLREATFSDFNAVNELKRRWALIPDSLENWERLWCANPALKTGRPIGWVLEVQGRIVGYLGNISSTYHYGGAALSAVTGHAFVVDSAYRAVSLSLVAAFYRQKSVDLYLTTTGSESVGKIALAFKCAPLPQEDYEKVLFWVLRPYPFARAVMKKVGLRPTLAKIVAALASVAIGTDRVFRGRRPRGRGLLLAVREISVEEIGADFERLWTEKLKEGPRLLADRTPFSLRWHFRIPGHRGTTRVLCCYRNEELFGYAVIRNDSKRASGLQRSFVADMLAKQDDPEVLTALLVAAFNHANKAGSHVLEVLGFPPAIRQHCSQWHPYLRKYPACPFFYKAANPLLHQALSDRDAWYASPFDGDTTLMPDHLF